MKFFKKLSQQAKIILGLAAGLAAFFGGFIFLYTYESNYKINNYKCIDIFPDQYVKNMESYIFDFSPLNQNVKEAKRLLALGYKKKKRKSFKTVRRIY